MHKWKTFCYNERIQRREQEVKLSCNRICFRNWELINVGTDLERVPTDEKE